MNPNEMLLVIPHSLLTSETIDVHVKGDFSKHKAYFDHIYKFLLYGLMDQSYIIS